MNTAVLTLVFSELPVEDRVRFERVSKGTKIAVDDSWRNKKSLTKSDAKWPSIPVEKRCEIISKMAGLVVVDMFHACQYAHGKYQKVLEKFVRSCSVIRRVDNDPELYMQLKYIEYHGSGSRIEMIKCRPNVVKPEVLKSIKKLCPSLKIKWIYGDGPIPEETNYLVADRRLNIFTRCDPVKLTNLQSISLQNQKLSSEQIEYIVQNFPNLESFKFFTNERTQVVTKSLMKLTSLKQLDYRAGHSNAITEGIFKYLRSDSASKLRFLSLELTSFHLTFLVEIVSSNLKELQLIRVVDGQGTLLLSDVKNVKILWLKDSLSGLLTTFPKAVWFHIKHSNSKCIPFWKLQLEAFAKQRRNKLIEVIVELQSKTLPMELEADNLRIRIK